MQHPNKDRLIEFYYSEANDLEAKRVFKHLQSCNDCLEYLNSLDHITGQLDHFVNQTPSEDTFDLIMKDIEVVPLKKTYKKELFSVLPFIKIVLFILFVLAALHFCQSWLTILPLWEVIREYRIIQVLGSYGLVAVVFFILGSFVTLSITPVLLMDSERLKNMIRQVCNYGETK
ncbi:MAG: hypothetical protein QUS12_15445 [Methanosarcina sp.]|nr:hypothetical protein [Methanosarcina sp.]